MLRRLAIGFFIAVIGVGLAGSQTAAQAAGPCGGWTAVCSASCPLNLESFCQPYNRDCAVDISGTVCNINSPDCGGNEAEIICAWEAPK